MEYVISVVAFVIVSSLFYVVRSLVSRPDVKGKPVLGEAFPRIDVLEPLPAKNSAPLLSKPALQPNAAEETKEVVPVQEPVAAIKEKPKSHKKPDRISLSDKSEAKKAFIYSEVFKRKY